MLFPYLLRNIYTIIYHGNNFQLTSNFIAKNQNQIRYLPAFVKYTNPKIRLKKKTTTRKFII